MVFESRAYAAPEACLRLRVYAVVARAHRREVDEAAVVVVLRRENVVEDGSFAIVHVGGVAAALVEHAGEAEHVVGVASLGTLLAFEHAREIVGRMEMLAYAVAAYRNRPFRCHVLPEEVGGAVPRGIAFDVGDALETDNFRNLGIGVHAREAVLAVEQRFEHIVVRETVSEGKILVVACDGGHVGENFVEAAVLAAQHLLHLLVGKLRSLCHHPVG